MKPHLLLAEDDPTTRLVTQRVLRDWRFDPIVVADGGAALEALEALDGPCVAVLDWMMPSVDGVEVVRRVRRTPVAPLRYLILLTSRQTKEDVVQGLEAGADDYVGKPFHPAELRARIGNGMRLLEAQSTLRRRVDELETAMRHVRQLQELLPICTYCKRVRNDENYWTQVESYLADHLDVQFSHGICPSCYESVVEPELDALGRSDERPARTSGEHPAGTGDTESTRSPAVASDE